MLSKLKDFIDNCDTGILAGLVIFAVAFFPMVFTASVLLIHKYLA